MEKKALQPLPGSPGCFICDNNGSNPRALALRLFWDEGEQTVHLSCEPDQTWCGYNDIVHGGLVASILDEAMAWAVKMKVGDWAFTADYQLRYKKAVTPGQTYLAQAKVVKDAGRKITAEALLTTQDGQMLAKASATFLPAKGRAMPRTAGQA